MCFLSVALYNPIDYNYLISLTYSTTLMLSQGIQLSPMLYEVSAKQ